MRKFDHNSTWEDVQNMTIEEAIAVLSHNAKTSSKLHELILAKVEYGIILQFSI